MIGQYLDDKRIHYRILDQNLGISGNTNAAIEMASGDYIALFDHDDLLCENALYEVAKTAVSSDADIIYTDEDKIKETRESVFSRISNRTLIWICFGPTIISAICW